MKVTTTRVEKTLYDTNGNKISMIKKETVEVDTQVIIPHNRKEGKAIREHIEVYKTNLNNAKEIKEGLVKSRGHRKGGKIFSSMADLIMIVDNPIIPKQTTHYVGMDFGTGESVSTHIWDAAKYNSGEFQKPLTKKKKK